MLAAALLMLAIAGQVIAAPDAVNQLPPDQPKIQLLITIVIGAIAALVIWRLKWYWLDSAPPRVPLTPGPSEPLVLFGLLLAMFLLGQTAVAVAVTLGLVDLPADPEASYLTLEPAAKLTAVLYAGQALVLVVWAVLRFRQTTVSDRRWSWGRSVLLGFAAIVVCWPLMVLVGVVSDVLYQWLGGPVPDVIAHETLRLLRTSAHDVWFWMMIAMVVLATPVLEELAYRGLLQQLLRSSGEQLAAAGFTESGVDRFVHRTGVVLSRPWIAIGVTSLIFTSMHVGAVAVYALPSLFVLSLGLGWARERTGRLTAPIVMHALFNAANLLQAQTLTAV